MRVSRPFRNRGERQRGAALVEMAIILPLLITLVFGIVEYGLLFKEKLTVASSTKSAARTGATMGTRESADIRMLEALEAGLFDQVDASVLISVEIFRADPVTGAKTGDVNHYSFIPSSVTCKWTPCPDPDEPGYAGFPEPWAPALRDTTLEPGGGGVDMLGIEVTYHHTSATDLIPGVDRDLHERALIRLEPDVFGM
ncbi:MAG: TadE/TadG family type IV pilus assembly protein [Acidimicrobiia bacterium]